MTEAEMAKTQNCPLKVGGEVELTLPRERIEQDQYACAIHEAGHAVAACAVGFGMKERGIVLRDSNDGGGLTSGSAHTRSPGIHSQDSRKRELFYRYSIVVTFAGPIAEYMVNRALVHIGGDVRRIVWSLRELLPSKKQLLADGLDQPGDYWDDLWAIAHILATRTKRDIALQGIDDYKRWMEEDEDPSKIDMEIFDMLWPFAQQAHAIINLHWSSINTLACELLKTRSLRREDIEVL